MDELTQSPIRDEDQLVKLVTISQQLAVELENFDDYINANGVAYHQIENWVTEMKDKLKQVQLNV